MKLPFSNNLAILGLMLVSGSGIWAQQAGADCSAMVHNRSYANNFTGFLNVPVYLGVPDSGTVGDVPNAGAGMMTFYPGGKVTNRETIAIGLLGLQQDLLIQGTYKLQWDTSHKPALCTGTLSESDGSTQYDFNLVVTENGDRMEMVHTNVGLIVGTTGHAMKMSGCANSTIEGKYTYNTMGWGLATPDVPRDQTLAGYLPAVMTGAMRFRADVPPSPSAFPDAPLNSGSVEAWDTLSINGKPVSRTMSGWYTVDRRDCSGVLVLRDNLGYPDYRIELFAGKEGDALYAVNVNTIDFQGAAIPMFLMRITLDREDSWQR